MEKDIITCKEAKGVQDKVYAQMLEEAKAMGRVEARLDGIESSMSEIKALLITYETHCEQRYSELNDRIKPLETMKTRVMAIAAFVGVIVSSIPLLWHKLIEFFNT